MRVLIVEDDADTRDLLRDLLEMHAHEVLTAGDGAQAMAILQQPPASDVLVTDVHLPGMSGIALATAARAEYPGLAIVVCSGFGEQQFASLLDDVLWLQKPVEMDALLRAIEHSPRSGQW